MFDDLPIMEAPGALEEVSPKKGFVECTFWALVLLAEASCSSPTLSKVKVGSEPDVDTSSICSSLHYLVYFWLTSCINVSYIWFLLITEVLLESVSCFLFKKLEALMLLLCIVIFDGECVGDCILG